MNNNDFVKIPGLSKGTAEVTYLRLDTANDPLTAPLRIDSEATTIPALDLDIVPGDAHLRLTGDSGNATPTEGDLWRESDGLKYFDGILERHLYVTAENFFHAYDTTTQSVAVANVFQPVIFDTNHHLNGWTHTAGTSGFTCNQTGTYLISFNGHCQKTSGGNSLIELRIVSDGTEEVGTAVATTVSSNNNIRALPGNFILNVAAGVVLELEITGDSTGSELVAPPGDATVNVSVTFIATRIV